MDANPPTAADFAWSDAQAAQLSVSDCMVIIGWLGQRVSELERRSAIPQPPLPELPSRMTGFGCIPRREDAVKAAKSALVA